MKRGISVLLVFALILSIALPVLAQFSDSNIHWAKEEVNYLVNKGVIDGYPDGTFKPNNSMTKVEFYKIINELLEFEEVEQITYLDVNSNDWYYDDVAKALAAGYIQPATILYPNENISRQEVIRIIGKVYGLSENSRSAEVFTDYASLPKGVLGFIGTMLDNGLVAGYPDGTFRPAENITRAEVVKLIYSILNKLDDLQINVKASKEELESILEDIDALDQDDYTNKSWNDLDKVLREAKDVYDNNQSTQDNVDNVI